MVRALLDHRDSLRGRHRRVFNLRMNEGLSHEQIARRTGLTIEQVAHAWRCAVQRLEEAGIGRAPAMPRASRRRKRKSRATTTTATGTGFPPRTPVPMAPEPPRELPPEPPRELPRAAPPTDGPLTPEC